VCGGALVVPTSVEQQREGIGVTLVTSSDLLSLTTEGMGECSSTPYGRMGILEALRRRAKVVDGERSPEVS
jgi:hypothetical protein